MFYDSTTRVFHLTTDHSSYIMQILPSGHLAHLYYGARLPEPLNLDTLNRQPPFELGNSTSYSPATGVFSLNTTCLELSTYGKGDYREPSLHVELHDGTRVTDFTYVSHEVFTQRPHLEGLPHVRPTQTDTLPTLVIRMSDQPTGLILELYYTLIASSDAIVRRMRLTNAMTESIVIDKIMSAQLDFSDARFSLVTLDGTWINERQIHDQPLRMGITKIDSKRGTSSSDHHPFLALRRPHTDETNGECYGMALIYSGNFEAIVEVSPHELTRIQLGINSFDFRWPLAPSTHFDTPEVVLTYSQHGLNELSHHFHGVVQRHLVTPAWQHQGRPILINNWEATYFNFNERKLLRLARQAHRLGIELFVLDDGWFGQRHDDRSSLGDYSVNRKKLPHGLNGLQQRMARIGMKLGIWVEPEMVSPDSELYRAHPDWAIQLPHRSPSLGRNQLVLNLTNPEVESYILEQLRTLFRSTTFSYCKWDMNRNLSDLYGTTLSPKEQLGFAHRYVLALYRILHTLTTEFPQILFESCASGGNRFDLGMVYYMPQGWISDNSDGIHRLKIQYGTSLVFPPSTMGCHVSAAPNHQLLRHTPLATRFNVAAFGLLGYELDLSSLSPVEKRAIRQQITTYKRYRTLFQTGQFYRIHSPFEGNEVAWMVVDATQEQAILGVYQILQQPNYRSQRIPLVGLHEDSLYQITTLRQSFNLRQFGDLVSRVLPIRIPAKSPLFTWLANHVDYPIETQVEQLTGAQLTHDGWIPFVQFTGNGTNAQTRVMGDFGSRLYHLQRQPSIHEKTPVH